MRTGLLITAVCAALLAAPALPLPAAQPATVTLTVSGDTGDARIATDAAGARIASYINGWYGGILEIVASRAQGAARVILSPAAGGLSARTELARGTARTSRVTVVPRDSLGSLIPAVACDLVYLWSASEGFENIPLSAGPGLVASLSTDEVAGLMGWNPEDMEPLGITGSDGSTTVVFPHGWITLGPSFSITTDTARDILAQSFGREPLQLSGIVRMRGTLLAALSERAAKIAWIDTRLASREVRDAPALPAGHAERFGHDAICALASGSVFIYQAGENAPAAPGGNAPAAPISLASAFTTDAEGNLWLYDARQMRIRVLTTEGGNAPAAPERNAPAAPERNAPAAPGREIYSIRPLARGAALQFPQQIAVFDDGSFLLGGAGEVWKFRNTGVPVWKLDRIAGPVAEGLPSTFQIAVDRRSGSFTLLDGPSRRLLSFAPDGAEKAPSGDGLLLALQEGARAERQGEGSEALSAARLALLKRKTSLLADLAASFSDELLPGQAERALLRASEAAREALAEDPSDAQIARLLEEMIAARRLANDSLTQEPAATLSRARAISGVGPAGRALAVSLVVRNTRGFPLSRVRLSLTAPGLSLMPSLVELGTILPNQEKQVEVSLPLADPFEPIGQVVQAAALMSWEHGSDGRNAPGGTAPTRFTLQTTSHGQVDRAAALRHELILAVDPEDQLVRASIAELAAGTEDPYSAAATVLDALGRMRQASAAASPGAAGAYPPAPASPAAPSGVRKTLRGLSADPLDWALLSADVVSALGFPVGALAWADAAVILVDTGVPLAKALARIPALARDEALLRKLARDGRLCVPLSGEILPASSPLTPSVFALLAGLRACREHGVDPLAAAWQGQPGRAAPRAIIPSPFPARFPVVTPRLDRDTLAAGIQSAMEQQK